MSRFLRPFWLCVVITVVLIALIFIDFRIHYGFGENDLGEIAYRGARGIASVYDSVVDGTRNLLVALAQFPEIQNMDGSACNKTLAGLLKKYSQYANIGLADKNGNLICSGVAPSHPVKIDDRSYFQQAIQMRDFSVGEYQIGRITGDLVVVMGYPVADKQGVLKGVIFASLPLRWLDDLLQKYSLPADSSLTVIDNTGTILVRYPDSKKWTGGSLYGTSLAEAVFSKKTGSVTTPDIDGTVRTFSFQPWGSFVPAGGKQSYIIVGIGQRPIYPYASVALMLAAVILASAATLWFHKGREHSKNFSGEPPSH